jgi:hypothetical protein
VQDFGKNGSGLLVTKVCEEEEGWKKKVFLFQNMSFVGSKPVWTINEWMNEWMHLQSWTSVTKYSSPYF